MGENVEDKGASEGQTEGRNGGMGASEGMDKKEKKIYKKGNTGMEGRIYVMEFGE